MSVECIEDIDCVGEWMPCNSTCSAVYNVPVCRVRCGISRSVEKFSEKSRFPTTSRGGGARCRHFQYKLARCSRSRRRPHSREPPSRRPPRRARRTPPNRRTTPGVFAPRRSYTRRARGARRRGGGALRPGRMPRGHAMSHETGLLQFQFTGCSSFLLEIGIVE